MMKPNGTSVMTFSEPLLESQRTGAIIVAIFASLSTVALAFITLRTIGLAAAAFLQRDHGTAWPPEILFFRTQLGHYGGCLIISNLFMSLAGLIELSWAASSRLSQGSMCLTQAALMQIGIWGTCCFTAALGIHTLVSFVFRIGPARWRSPVAVAIGWTIAFVAGLAPLQESSVYGPIGFSCGVTYTHTTDIFVLEVFPIILTAFVSTTVYSVIFIVLHRKININGVRHLRGYCSDQRRGDGFGEYHEFMSTLIWTMFWFPLVFILLLLPFCIMHMAVHAGRSVPFAWNVFADVCASMLGFANVCLLCNTFRVISPVYCERRHDKILAETVRTFGNDASGESPIGPPKTFVSQSTTWSRENGHHNSVQPSRNHSRDYSLGSVDSSTELLGAQKASSKSSRTKLIPLVLSGAAPPPRLHRQSGGGAPLRPVILYHPSRRVSRNPSWPRPLPKLPGPKDNERDVVDASPPSPRTMRTQSHRTTVTTVWSQESGYTLSQPDAQPVALEMYPQQVANLLVSEGMLGDNASKEGR